MNCKPVFLVNGVLLLTLAGAMTAPMAVDLAGGSADWKVFASASVTTAFIGALLIFSNREKEFRLTVRETFLATFLGWILMGVFGALPFCLSALRLGPAQGFFEAMSGLSTTGLTVMTGLDGQPHGILLWRALLSWLGGIGGLALTLSILPLLQVNGMQIFRSQSFDIAKILPSTSQTATWILLIYAGLTLACTLLLMQAGMTFFDAACHGMSALSTGGFSTFDASAAHFNSLLIEMILMYFMLLGSVPFTLYLRMARGDLWAIFRDGQVRAFLAFTCALALLLALYLLLHNALPLRDAVRHAAFRAVSLMTTSGLTLEDGGMWGPFAVALGFMAVFIGGCSGSTSGGIRIFRLQILLSTVKLHIRKLIVPSGIFHAYHNQRPIDAETRNAVAVFMIAFAALCPLAGIALMGTGLDFQTAFAGAFAALTNAGPSLTGMLSPALNGAALPAPALWILSACMLLGRLEIFGVLVFFAPRFWRA